MNVETSLRPVTEADRDLLVRLFASVRDKELVLMPWSSDAKAAFVEMQFTAQSHHYAEYFPEAEHSIVERGGVPIGRIYIDRRPEEIRVVDVALMPAYRGAGIGTKLLSGLLEEGQRSGRPVRLSVEHSNRAQRLYERLGFARIRDLGAHLELEWSPVKPAPAPC